MRELSFEEELGFFRCAVDYEDYERGLRALLCQCHSQLQLDTVKVAIDEVKGRLMESNLTFKQILDTRTSEAKTQSDMHQAIQRAKMNESRLKANRTRKDIQSKLGTRDLDWVSQHRIKTYDPEEKKKSIDAGTGCPNPKCKDHGKNRGNVLNNTPVCMSCMHRLVPKSEFKDYNRKYWRRFNRKKK